MAIRNKFIHFKTRAAFNSYLETHADDLYNYTTFIKETKEIYTHGQFYKSSNKWAISSLIGNSDYATLAYNNGKVGDIFDMSSGTTVHGILGTINDKKWYIFYKDSIREYIYNTDTKKFTAGATINLANDSEIPEATSGSYGGIKIGYQAADKSYAVQLDSNGKAYVNVPWEKGTGTITQINAGLGMKPKLITGRGTLDLSLRSSTQMSLSSQNASTVSGKVYAVQLDKDGYLGVSVPWTDTNTNYYPTTFTWTNGTSKGPTGSLTGTGMSAVSFGSIPIASLSNSGVITTEAQEISGEKYFNNGVFVGLSGSASRGIIDGKDFGYDGLAIVSDSNVYIAPDNNIVYFGYDGDTYIQDGVFSGTASKANMVTGALTIHSGSTNITYNGSKTEEITIPRNRQTNLTWQAYGSDSSISVKKGICYYHNTGSLWATSINLSLNTADWSRIESTNDTEIIETSMVVVESAYPVTFSSNSMLKVQKDIPLTGDTGTYRVYVFSRITPTRVAVNCAVYKAS